MKTVAWFSAGISSFVASWLARDWLDEIIYVHIQEQHEDSIRFLNDAERLIGKPIRLLQSPYKSVENVIRSVRYVNGPGGAACTNRLKTNVRKEWEARQNEPLCYVWGFDASKRERERAKRVVESMPLQSHRFPLIETGMDKEQAHGLAKKLGIKRPAIYDLGFPNNNCVPCVKMGMYSFNLVRKHFPVAFARLAALEREIGHSCLKNCFLDELEPNRGRKTDEIAFDCGISCQIAFEESVQEILK